MSEPRAALFRNGVTIEGEFEDVPPPPEGPKLFRLGENTTTIIFDKVITGTSVSHLRDRCTMKVKFHTLGDETGTVLSFGADIRDRHGELIENFNLALDAEDARNIGAAIDALLSLAAPPQETLKP